MEGVGDGVSRVKVGDLVCPTFSQTWTGGTFSEASWQGTLGGPLDGTMQEYMCLSEQGVVKAPPHLSAAEAATLPCAALTAWNAVVAQGQTKAGDIVLIQGTGGVSLFALIFAKLQGAETILISSSDEKLARAKPLGADHLINYKTTPDWAKAAREIAGRGLDHVVEVGGGSTLEQSIRAVRPSAFIGLIGVLGGGTGAVNLGPVVTQNIRLQGVTVGSRDLFEEMNRALTLHKVKPPLDDKRFASNESRIAHRAILEPMIEAHFAAHTAEELLDKLIPAGMACAAAYRVSDVMDSDHARARGSVLEITYPEIGPVKSAANPIKLSDAPVDTRRKSPMVGEHTAEIMREIYFALLGRIEAARFDVFTAVLRIPRPTQARLALRTWWRLRR